MTKVTVTRVLDGQISSVSWEDYKIEEELMQAMSRPIESGDGTFMGCFRIGLPEGVNPKSLGTGGRLVIPEGLECTGDDLRHSDGETT